MNTDLRQAWKACMEMAKEEYNIWVALVMQDCAIRISHLIDEKIGEANE